MMAQSLGFYFTAHYLSNIDDYATREALVRYVVHQNCVSYLVLFLLVCGTLGSWRGEVLRRRRAADEAARPKRPTFTTDLAV